MKNTKQNRFENMETKMKMKSLRLPKIFPSDLTILSGLIMAQVSSEISFGIDVKCFIGVRVPQPLPVIYVKPFSFFITFDWQNSSKFKSSMIKKLFTSIVI